MKHRPSLEVAIGAVAWSWSLLVGLYYAGVFTEKLAQRRLEQYLAESTGSSGQLSESRAGRGGEVGLRVPARRGPVYFESTSGRS